MSIQNASEDNCGNYQMAVEVAFGGGWGVLNEGSSTYVLIL